MRPILAGKRVIELGSMLAAPFATHILQQLGSEVIKIEPPVGDPTRSLVRGGPSGTLIAYSRGKKSLCADLRSEEGYAILEKLLASADILVHNLAPDSARRLKVTYEDCLAIKPDLVYCHIRGYGPGPQENGLASNPVAEAATGAMYFHRIDGRPSRLGPSYHDQFAGCYAVIGILGALLDTSGEPGSRRVEFGLYETGLHIAARDVTGIQLKTQLTGKTEAEPSGEFSMPGYGAYETSDGRWIYLVMLNDGHWKKFWSAMPSSAGIDPSLATLRQRKKQREHVEALVRGAISGLTYQEARRRLDAVAFGYTEVLSPAEILNVPQAREVPKFTAFPFQGYRFETPDFPLTGPGDETDPNVPPSLLGQHSIQILESLGYSREECNALIERQVISIPPTDKPVWAPMRAGG